MPCQDPWPEGTRAAEEEGCRARLDKVTQFLCWLCGELEEDKLLDKYTRNHEELRKWKDEHDNADMNRVYLEMYRFVCSGRCDPDEWELLGGHFINLALKVHPVSRSHRKWFLRMAHQVCLARRNELRAHTKKMSLKAKVLKRLSPEEREALGFSNRKPKPKKRRKK
jgi:hypothetical protein